MSLDDYHGLLEQYRDDAYGKMLRMRSLLDAAAVVRAYLRSVGVPDALAEPGTPLAEAPREFWTVTWIFHRFADTTPYAAGPLVGVQLDLGGLKLGSEAGDPDPPSRLRWFVEGTSSMPEQARRWSRRGAIDLPSDGTPIALPPLVIASLRCALHLYDPPNEDSGVGDLLEADLVAWSAGVTHGLLMTTAPCL